MGADERARHRPSLGQAFVSQHGEELIFHDEIRDRPRRRHSLAGEQAVIPDGHHMLAPALLRSQMLSLLYQAVHRGEMTKEDAERRLFYARGMRIRRLEDHILQNAAWNVADQLGWPDTFDAEYVALTQLEADALITLDRQLADAAKNLVAVAPIEALF